MGREGVFGDGASSSLEGRIPEGAKVRLSGQVFWKERASDYQVLYLRDTSVIYREQVVQEPYVMIYEDGEEEIRLGNTLLVSGKLKFFEEARNPGGFSQKGYYRTRKLAAYVWSEELRLLDTGRFPLREWLSSLRIRWKELLLQRAGAENGGILCAVLLGDRRQMDGELKELYQVNGMAHVLAISGLHLSFVGLGFYRLMRRATGSYLLAGAAGIGFLLLYILMIGMSVSAVRALIMFIIRVGADMSGRAYDGATSLAVAAAGVILWRPLSFSDAGFWLSFGAVGGVLLLYPAVTGDARARMTGDREEGQQRKKGNPLLAGLRDSLGASLCIQAATLPTILYYYYEFPPYSLLLNLVVIPLMSALLLFGFGGSMLCLFWPDGGGACFALCGLILKLYRMLCEGICLLPGYHVIAGKPLLVGVFAYLASVLAWALLSGSGHKLYGAAAFAAGAAALLCASPAVSHKGLEVTFLDVGQGDGIFLRERGGIACLIDGGSSDVSAVGKYRIEPFLKARGVSRVDYAFVTHGDEDHVSGLRELLERQQTGVKISCVVFPERSLWDEKLKELCALAESMGTHTAIIRPGQRVRGKELALLCLAPDEGLLTEAGNAASLVLEGSYGEIDFLFTGDVEGQGEDMLTGVLEKECEILKTAHHGSKNSTGEEFLEKAKPKLAVISAGKENRYGHPHAETLERLRESGAAVANTAESGALILKADGKEVENLKVIQYNRSYEKLE